MNKYKKQCPECRGDGVARPEPGIDYLCPSCCGSGKIEDPMEPPANAMQGPLDGAGKCSSITNELHEKSSVLDQSWRHLISEELTRAKSKFPQWPTDPMHAIGVLGEEYGEVLKDCLQLTYEPGKTNLENLRSELIQLAAMCHRFLESLYRYEFKPSSQHSQS